MIDAYQTRLIQFLPTHEDLEVFCTKEIVGDLLMVFDRITVWFRALTDVHDYHRTSIMLSAAHSKIIEIWALIPMGLIHPAYTALRTIVDICTSYTYYTTHPIEWAAVCDGKADWESRGGIVKWHIQYTPSFSEINKVFGLGASLDEDYRDLSSFVHGIPLRGLPTLSAIERTHISDQDLQRFIQLADKTISHLNLMFISVFHEYLVSLPGSGPSYYYERIRPKETFDDWYSCPSFMSRRIHGCGI